MAAIAAVIQARPKTRFLVLTAHDEPGYVRAATDAGAVGFVVKTAVETELLGAIRAVAEGRRFIDTSISLDLAFRSSQMRAGAGTRGRGGTNHLTAREREVLRRVAEGFTNVQIAAELGLGLKSIETYRSRLMSKLGFDSRADLVRFALECGILSPGKSTR